MKKCEGKVDFSVLAFFHRHRESFIFYVRHKKDTQCDSEKGGVSFHFHPHFLLYTMHRAAVYHDAAEHHRHMPVTSASIRITQILIVYATLQE